MKNSNKLKIKEFKQILYNGFYYIYKNDIYFENNAIFIGNGYHDYMIKTHYLKSKYDNDKILKDSHYFDWAKKEDIWDFTDYGKTWHIDKRYLERRIHNEVDKENKKINDNRR